MKYIIEIKPEYEDSFKGLMILGAKDSNLFVDVAELDNLEELNSDYINEHFGDLQDTAYRKGRESVFHELEISGSQKGESADDVWEAVKKIVFNPDNGGLSIQELNKIFGNASIQYVCRNYSASEAIKKLKAHEEKQKAEDKIKVGDEVEWTGDKYIVTYINYNIDTSEITDYDLLGEDGSVEDHVKNYSFVKTGRHFDIEKILEEMRHG